MTDVRSETSGDLDLTTGLVIASLRDRDRAMVIARAMTVRGECPTMPRLGIRDTMLGKRITADVIRQVESEVYAAIAGDLGLQGVGIIVRAVPTGLDELTVFIEIKRAYEDGDSQTIVLGDFWHRDEPITLIDGTEETV